MVLLFEVRFLKKRKKNQKSKNPILVQSLTSSLCQIGLETHENVSPVRLLVLPASAHVVNVTSTYTAFHVVFQHHCCHARPDPVAEMLKSANHRRGWKETEWFLVEVVLFIV